MSDDRLSVIPHPTSDRGTESDVVGRRIAATAVDTLVVFVVYYVGLLAFTGILSAAAVELLLFFNTLCGSSCRCSASRRSSRCMAVRDSGFSP